MSDPLINRRDVRRQICRANGMKFYQIYSPEGIPSISAYENVVDPTGVSRTILKSAGKLRERRDSWKGAWLLMITGEMAGAVRKIIASDPGNSSITTERTLPLNKLAVGNKFEILDWSPLNVHDAINRAIKDGYRAFPYVTDDTSLVLQEKKLEYNLENIPIWIPTQVWLERASSSIVGITTPLASVFPNRILDNKANWTINEHVGKLVSIYNVSGAGQVRTVQSNTATELTVDTNFTPSPFNSNYRLWDPRIQEEEWYRVPAGRFFPEENPERFYLTTNYPDYYGFRIRIIYIAGPTTLDTDQDTTRINSEYLTYKASSILHDMLVSDSTVNRSAHASIAEYNDRLSRDVLDRHRKVIPPFNMWIESDESGAGYREEETWRPW